MSFNNLMSKTRWRKISQSAQHMRARTLLIDLKFPPFSSRLEIRCAIKINKMASDIHVVVAKEKAERKNFKAPRSINRIPEDIINDPVLLKLTQALPSNYNFEIPKTIWRIRSTRANRVALQMPEGLLMFATVICDIIEALTEADTVIMGDVTYGACCIDDYTAKAMKVDLLVHYGHSCLIPINKTVGINVLYIFVDIKIDPLHFIETIRHNFDLTKRLGLVSTIQFVATLHTTAEVLREDGYQISIPQSRPLSAGEILGCTAPAFKNVDALIYLGDGRFHLEAAMIANPTLDSFRYDPYEKKFTQEYYSHDVMRANRLNAINKARNASLFGLILGTLGRQGSPAVLEYLQEKIAKSSKRSIVVLLSEIFPAKLALIDDVDAWVQVACPRLSIDWGTAFSKPLLTPYELEMVLNNTPPDWSSAYPMDFYANSSLGPWTPNHKHEGCSCEEKCKNES